MKLSKILTLAALAMVAVTATGCFEFSGEGRGKVDPFSLFRAE